MFGENSRMSELDKYISLKFYSYMDIEARESLLSIKGLN